MANPQYLFPKGSPLCEGKGRAFIRPEAECDADDLSLPDDLHDIIG